MRCWYKVVSASLVLMVLFAPSLSLALCSPPSAASPVSMNCPPACPMMAEMQGQEHGTALQSSEIEVPPCCAISSSHSYPIPESTFVVAPVVPVTLLEVVSEFNPPVEPQSLDQADTSPPPTEGTQALLCSFLI